MLCRFCVISKFQEKIISLKLIRGNTGDNLKKTIEKTAQQRERVRKRGVFIKRVDKFHVSAFVSCPPDYRFVVVW